MSEYTAHVQLPDTVIGTVLFDLTFDHPNVTTAILRGGHGSWLSFGVNAESDSEAVIAVDKVRMDISRMTDVEVEGYDEHVIAGFETAAMIMTNGRTVVYSMGV